MNYFRVRNFEQFQHYKKRNPPWIRLYYQILHDRRFYKLDDASKWLAVGIFLLASQHENKIAMDEPWIARELCLSTYPDWQCLLDAEFIQPIDCDASTLLAHCKQYACQSRAEGRAEQIVQKSDNSEAEILSLSPKSLALEAGRILKHWNSMSALMHHRSIDAHEKAIVKTARQYSEEEILLSISRYQTVRENREGKYRDLYQWTLSEFLTRENHKNVERFIVENWEQPFIDRNGNKNQPANLDFLDDYDYPQEAK